MLMMMILMLMMTSYSGMIIMMDENVDNDNVEDVVSVRVDLILMTSTKIMNQQ